MRSTVWSDWTSPSKHRDSPHPDAQGRRARGQEVCVRTPEGPAIVWSAEEDTQPQRVARATSSHIKEQLFCALKLQSQTLTKGHEDESQ